MSAYMYAGPFRNPTEGWAARQAKNGTWFVGVPVHCECGKPCCSKPLLGYRYHTNKAYRNLDEPEYADEIIENVCEFFEEDYDSYLEENHYEIAQMERYELWRNEY